MQEALAQSYIKCGNPNAHQALAKLTQLIAEITGIPKLVAKAKHHMDKLAELLASMTSQQQQSVTVISTSSYRPKHRPNYHDGKAETFRVFWLKYEADVLNNVNINTGDRVRYLRDAVSPDDTDFIVALDVERGLTARELSGTNAWL